MSALLSLVIDFLWHSRLSAGFVVVVVADAAQLDHSDGQLPPREAGGGGAVALDRASPRHGPVFSDHRRSAFGSSA